MLELGLWGIGKKFFQLGTILDITQHKKIPMGQCLSERVINNAEALVQIS